MLPTSKPKPGLYIVSTPIGNLGDITLRALQIVQAADSVFCEDTRVTQKLFKHYGISNTLRPYNDHNAAKVLPSILRALEEEKTIALVSDAGTPLISDPGYKLLTAAQQKNIYTTIIPGASSVIAALSLSGLPTDRFMFLGFLPPRTGARRTALEEAHATSATLIFFETARRLRACLEDIQQVMGDTRSVVIARELTKLHEEIITGTAQELLARFDTITTKGEIVLLLGPPKKQAASQETLDAALKNALKTLSVKDASAHIAKEYDIPKKQAYARALELKNA